MRTWEGVIIIRNAMGQLIRRYSVQAQDPHTARAMLEAYGEVKAVYLKG